MTRPCLLLVISTVACWTGGLLLITHANQLGAANYDYNGQPLDVAAVFLILLPIIVLAIWLAFRAARGVAAEGRRYQAWKATLTPEQRVAVELGETAALAGAAFAWYEHNRHEDARLSASVMGQPATARELRQVTPSLLGDYNPTADTQRLIDRYHADRKRPDGSWN